MHHSRTEFVLPRFRFQNSGCVSEVEGAWKRQAAGKKRAFGQGRVGSTLHSKTKPNGMICSRQKRARRTRKDQGEGGGVIIAEPPGESDQQLSETGPKETQRQATTASSGRVED